MDGFKMDVFNMDGFSVDGLKNNITQSWLAYECGNTT